MFCLRLRCQGARVGIDDRAHNRDSKSLTVLVCSGCPDRFQVGWLRQQNQAFAQFWRPEIHVHGIGRFLPKPLSLACGWLPALPPLHRVFLCVGILVFLCAQISASFKHTSQNGLEPALMTPGSLRHLFESHSPRTAPF